MNIFCNSLSIRIFDTLFALSRNSLTHSKYFSKLFPSQINTHTLKNGQKGKTDTGWSKIKLPLQIPAQNVKSQPFLGSKKSNFVKVLKLNSELGSGNVLNSNYCEISVCQTRLKNRVVIFSAIDNLVKGASGQAIQNMNLLYDFSVTDGLK